ncbi:PRY3 [Symbiodinium sp. CCMP2592]|nr:PRY3 [Symbiodinium sp. CCMP2592]
MPNDGEGRSNTQRPAASRNLDQALRHNTSTLPTAARSSQDPPPAGAQSSQEPEFQLGVELVGVDKCAPPGIQICQACNAIFEGLTTSGEGSEAHTRWQTTLRRICDKAKEDSQRSDVLKLSVFGLMSDENIEKFLLSTDHRRWKKIEEHTEHFLKLLDAPGLEAPSRRAPPPDAAERVQVFEHHHPQYEWRSLKPVVMDQSIREPATNTPFGHTGYMKYLTLQIIRKMEFNDIAITGQYYGEKYTPETQVLEWIKYKGEKDKRDKFVKDPRHTMRGLVAMFAPGDHDRKAGIHSIKKFKVPNAFLDLTFKASVRFKDTNFVQSVIKAVEELDEIYSEFGWRSWREDHHINSDFAFGEISINLVDLMEYLNLSGDGSMEKQKMEDVEKAFKAWKGNDAFKRRVVAILVEEGRGVADYEDYGTLVRWIREFFPAKEQYRILVHAHAGTNNHQDVASLKAVKHGANGIWAALIPQAAQAGHNSSLVFLDYLLHHGNEHVLNDFHLFQALECARHIYYLNFNTHDIPDDCPIWGERVGQETHSAFNVLKGETWRRKKDNFYDYWGEDEKLEINKLPDKLHDLTEEGEGEDRGNYRTSERQMATGVGCNEIVKYVDTVKALGFALMNAGIRVNMDRKDNLETLLEIARKVQDADETPCNCSKYWEDPTHERHEKMQGERCTCRAPSYLKADQHQGKGQ